MAKQIVLTSESVCSYRIIVRGNVGTKRVRRVRTVECTESAAFDMAGAMATEIGKAENMPEESLYFTVYPPTGMRIDGKVSKGHTVTDDGYIVKGAAAAA